MQWLTRRTEQNKESEYSNSLAQVWKVWQVSQQRKMKFAPAEDTASSFSLFHIDQAESIHTPEINQQVTERVK